jgi:hypothetical protein
MGLGNNVDQLLFKMAKAGEALKLGRGHFMHPSKHTPDKIDEKIRKRQPNEAHLT